MPEFIEWGQEPKEGMVLVGFSCGAVIEGKELKSEIMKCFQKKELGIREAVELVKRECLASFDEAHSVVSRMRKDFKKNRSLNQTYKYNINKVFWAFENDIPKDPRYFKLNIIDLNKIDFKKYEGIDKQLDMEKLIRDNISEKDLKRIKKSKAVKIDENDPEQKKELNLDSEWM